MRLRSKLEDDHEAQRKALELKAKEVELDRQTRMMADDKQARPRSSSIHKRPCRMRRLPSGAARDALRRRELCAARPGAMFPLRDCARWGVFPVGAVSRASRLPLLAWADGRSGEGEENEGAREEAEGPREARYQRPILVLPYIVPYGARSIQYPKMKQIREGRQKPGPAMPYRSVRHGRGRSLPRRTVPRHSAVDLPVMCRTLRDWSPLAIGARRTGSCRTRWPRVLHSVGRWAPLSSSSASCR